MKDVTVAKQPPPIPAVSEIENAIYDQDGEVICVVGLKEYAVQEPDGSISLHKRSQNIETVDHQIWNPSMAMGPKPILLGCCVICRSGSFSMFKRNRPSHGLCTLKNGRLCTDCGLFVCPHHRKVGSDGRARCPRCARNRRVRGLLTWVFFMREG